MKISKAFRGTLDDLLLHFKHLENLSNSNIKITDLVLNFSENNHKKTTLIRYKFGQENSSLDLYSKLRNSPKNIWMELDIIQDNIYRNYIDGNLGVELGIKSDKILVYIEE